MNTLDFIAHFESLGDAVPFVCRMQETLGAIHLFEDFDAVEIACLASYMQCFRAPPGSEIIREGEAGDFMLLVLDGSVEITKQDVRGQPQVISTVGPGKTLGEMSLIDGEPRFASCVTLTVLEFAVLDRPSMSRLISEQPRLGVKLLMELLMLLNQRLRSVSAQLMDCMETRRSRIR
jgi:CRP/FNR family cyclic AMP-dependent transcriptional regulator